MSFGSWWAFHRPRKRERKRSRLITGLRRIKYVGARHVIITVQFGRFFAPQYVCLNSSQLYFHQTFYYSLVKSPRKWAAKKTLVESCSVYWEERKNFSWANMLSCWCRWQHQQVERSMGGAILGMPNRLCCTWMMEIDICRVGPPESCQLLRQSDVVGTVATLILIKQIFPFVDRTSLGEQHSCAFNCLFFSLTNFSGRHVCVPHVGVMYTPESKNWTIFLLRICTAHGNNGCKQPKSYHSEN